MNKKENKRDSLDFAAQEGAAKEVVSRFGSATKEHYVAYSGKDKEKGKELKKGLNSIFKSKVHPNFEKQNLKQQGGFAAEVKYTARQNAEKIIQNSKERVTRTDDIGRINDPLYDHVFWDDNGAILIGSGEQMKFVGDSPRHCLDKLRSPKFQKYLDADVTLTVPSDYYQGMLEEADKVILKLQRQLDRVRQMGNVDKEQQLIQKIQKLEKIKKNLKNSGVTKEEALEARLHPKYSTAKDIGKISHRAGVEQAKIGALVGGGLSLIRNIVSVYKGEKTAMEAAKDLGIDTLTGAGVGYLMAFSGSAIKGAMQNASHETLRTLSKSNAPAMVMTSTIEIGKSMKKFVKGEISTLEYLQELGEKGTGHLSSAMFAAIGQVAIPIPIMGAMAGSMLGYALSTAFYNELVGSLKEEKISYERRLKAEKDSKEAIALIESFRKDMNHMVEEYLSDHKQVFSQAFNQMDNALLDDNMDLFIGGANKITAKLKGTVNFETMDEFDSIMNNNNQSFKL